MTTTHTTQEQKQKSKTKNATPAQSDLDWWDMSPDVEDLEKIVERELKKLKEFEIVSTKEK